MLFRIFVGWPTALVSFYGVTPTGSLTGTTLDQIQNMGWTAAHTVDALPEVTKRWQASLATGEPFEMESRLRASTGDLSAK